MRRILVPFVLVALVAVAAGCSDDTKTSSGPGEDAIVVWPAPPDPMALARKAGLDPAPTEQLVNHKHTRLDVFLDGTPVIVPANIGIDLEVAAQGSPCPQPCISPLHTHDTSGLVHTESASPEDLTLGQFFTEWAVRLTADCVGEYCGPAKPVALYVDGDKVSGDPNAIKLADNAEIAVVIGTPPAEIPEDSGLS
jgi:hypothetical protein